MNCPACLSILSCKSEIHKISPTKNRMDLCCWNNECPARNILMEEPLFGFSNHTLIYVPWVQVITNDPHPWEVIAYGLITNKNNRIILVEGSCKSNSTVSKLTNGVNSSITDINIKWKQIKKTEYIQLSSGNDMHVKLNEISDKAHKLIPFI